MKNFQCHLTIIVLFLVSFTHQGTAQDESLFDVSYDVQRVYQPLAISRTQLVEAKTVQDLNEHYTEVWIKEYLSVEVVTLINDESQKVVGKNGKLNDAQLNNLTMADPGSEISVNVRYIPNNDLKRNDIKEINFSFTVDPEKKASYIGGIEKMQNYIKEKATDRISDDRFQQYHLSAVKFTIDEEGHIADAHVLESSKDEKVDEILLETVCNMDQWEPAKYSNGMKVKQQFVLTAGDLNSCVINLLGIRR